MSVTFGKNTEYRCSICGNTTKFAVSNIFQIKTAHSETPVDKILQRLLNKTSSDFFQKFQNTKNCACQDCLIKIDEYDLAYTNAKKIENELINLILKSNDRKNQKKDIGKISFKHESFDLSYTGFCEYIKKDDEVYIVANADIKEELKKPDSTCVAKCEICNVEFQSIDELYQHEHTYELPNMLGSTDDVILEENEEEGQRTIKLSGNLKPSVMSSVADKCSECDEKFHNKTAYREHMREHRKNKYKCEHCEKSFTNEILLDIHQAVHNGRSELECPHCLKVLSSKGAMVKHRRIHLQVKKYQCERCGKQFVHDTSFRMHMYAHDNTRKVSCKVCHRQFRCTPHLNRHMRIHTGEKPYSCPTCGRLFAQRYNMMMHYKSHDPNSGDHKCTICDKSFVMRKRLNEHLKLEHNIILEMNENKTERPRRIPVFDDAVTIATNSISLAEISSKEYL